MSFDEQNKAAAAGQPIMVNVSRMDRDLYFEAVRAGGNDPLTG